MEMHQLRYFLAVCETLHFTRAAESCNVSQPSLTRAIKKLEEELGGPLFHRERNLTHLTELGQMMRPYLEKSLASAKAAKDAAHGVENLENAPLVLGVMCTIGPSRISGLISKIHREMPGVRLSLQDAVPDELIGLLLEGGLDVALFGMPQELPERFDKYPLYRERFVVAFPPGHRFERQNAVKLGDLDQEPYLVRSNCEYTDYIGDLLAEKDVSLDVRYESEREDWIQSMIMTGMGCSLMPEYLSMHPNLRTRLIVNPEVTRQIELVTVSGRRFSPAVAALVRMARTDEWSA